MLLGGSIQSGCPEKSTGLTASLLLTISKEIGNLPPKVSLALVAPLASFKVRSTLVTGFWFWSRHKYVGAADGAADGAGVAQHSPLVLHESAGIS